MNQKDKELLEKRIELIENTKWNINHHKKQVNEYELKLELLTKINLPNDH